MLFIHFRERGRWQGEREGERKRERKKGRKKREKKRKDTKGKQKRETPIAASCTHLDWGLNPQLFGVWDNAPTSWATQPGLFSTLWLQNRFYAQSSKIQLVGTVKYFLLSTKPYFCKWIFCFPSYYLDMEQNNFILRFKAKAYLICFFILQKEKEVQRGEDTLGNISKHIDFQHDWIQVL